MDDTPTMPPTTDQPTPPVSDAPALKKKPKDKDLPGMRLHTRATISRQELCASLKIDCTTARRKLRNAGEKPSLYGTWEFERADVPRIKKLLLA
jgi:hypothetical protein